MNQSPRLLIIGLDGLNLDLIKRLLPAGTLPTLHQFISTGQVGPLTSVFPTHSASAWSSFMTGLSPAGHGVVDFKVRLANGRYCHAKPDPATTLWHILGQRGYRVGVFNFPVTYPPDPVNGWMVAGMLSTDLRRLSYPADLAGEILARFPDYQLDVEWTLYENRPGDLLRDLTRMVRQRDQIARFLLEREPLDCFAAAFIATDRAQHALWRYLDPEHPFYDPFGAAELQPALHEFYASLDQAVAGLLDKAGSQTLVILLSDHGFQSAAWQFHANDWLAQQGWLHYAAGASRIERWVRRLDTPRIRSFRRKLFTDVSRHFSTFSPGGTLDWSSTRAFCPWNTHQGIRINLRGRETYGVVEPGREFEDLRAEISTCLASLRHPASGAPVVRSIYRAEEIYRGPYWDVMPDLVFELHPNFASGVYRQKLFAPTGWASGDHSLEGFIALRGEDFPPGKASCSRLVDVVPTVLKSLGMPSFDKIPAGNFSAKDPDLLTSTEQAEIDPNSLLTTSRGKDLTEAEELDLLDHLRNLGYLE